MEKGGYPTNLSLLVEEEYLANLPIDPYSDKPLVYKKTDDNFTLYSLSRNLEDDAGEPAYSYYRSDEGGVEMIRWPADGYKKRAEQWRDEGDTVFWPLQ
jgi:hypothetical protein